MGHVGHWKLRWSRQRREMVADCEAFLLGRLAERLEDQGVEVPNWAWTNLLAHGSVVALWRECMTEPRDGPPEHHDWRRARAYVAAEVLGLADALGSLRIIQERVVRPLELEFAVSPDAIGWSPAHWAARVSRALAEHAMAERAKHRRVTSADPHKCA